MVAVHHPYLGVMQNNPNSDKLLDESSAQLEKVPYLHKVNSRTDCLHEWERFEKSHIERKKFIREYGFSVYSKETLNVLAQFLKDQGNTALEVFAGSGYLSTLLANRNVSVTASDKGAECFDKYKISNVYKRDIECDVLALNTAEFKTIIMAWPEMNTNAYLIARKMQPGQLLVYIGEDEGGCTATEEFFNELRDNWEPLKEVQDSLNEHHYSFLSIYDRFFVYRKL